MSTQGRLLGRADSAAAPPACVAMLGLSRALELVLEFLQLGAGERFEGIRVRVGNARISRALLDLFNAGAFSPHVARRRGDSPFSRY